MFCFYYTSNMTKRLIVFKKTTTTVFIYLTIVVVAMLNASLLHQTARKRLISTAFRQMATLVFATSRSNMDKRLINKRKTITIVFIYATTMHFSSFPLYKSNNPSRTMSRPHHDLCFLLHADARGGAYPRSRFSLVRCLND